MATGAYAPSREAREQISEVTKLWDECADHHGRFCRAYERRERAYRGILTSTSQAAKWRHKQHPPLAFNLIETVVSNTVEMGMMFDVRPSPKVNLTLEEAEAAVASADAVGDLLRHEHRVDDMDYKQRPLYLSMAIAGRGVGKSYWTYSTGPIRKQAIEMRPVDEDGQFMVPVVTQIETEGTIRDHSTFEVIDPRDFVVNESAKALQPWEPGGAQYLFHRCWYSYEQLKIMEAAGDIENVEYLKESQDQGEENENRGDAVFDINRAKGLIEVLEYWCMKDGRVHRSLVGNRKVLLRKPEPSPFWHEGYPFHVGSSAPQLFTTVGMSDMELIESLQEMLWEIMNQRLDNVELINNAITLIRSDVDDPDAFEYYPGARWPVDDTSQIETLLPPYQLLEGSMGVEAGIRGDLQNVTASTPFASGTETATVDQKTATGASLVMSAAQQRLQFKKWLSQAVLKDEAETRLKNCQQFISDDKLVHVLGPDGKLTFRQIGPLDIQGEYSVELEAMGESTVREQRRAEAIQLGQVLVQAAPLAAAAGAPLNIHEVLAYVIKKFDIADYERFFSQKPESSGAVAGNMGGAAKGQQAPAPPGPNMGITSGTAVDASSPSATGGNTLSPEAAMARALSMGGGANNV